MTKLKLFSIGRFTCFFKYQVGLNLNTQSMIWISKKDPMPLSREAASLATKHNIPVKGGESGELSIYKVFFNCSSRLSVSKWRRKNAKPTRSCFTLTFSWQRSSCRLQIVFFYFITEYFDEQLKAILYKWDREVFPSRKTKCLIYSWRRREKWD